MRKCTFSNTFTWGNRFASAAVGVLFELKRECRLKCAFCLSGILPVLDQVLQKLRFIDKLNFMSN